MFFWFVALVISIGLCLQSLYLLTLTVRRKSKFHATLSVSFIAALATIVFVFIPIFPIYFLIKSIVWVIGSWVLLTVFAYRRPIVRIRVYEYSADVCLNLLIQLLLGPDVYTVSLVILSVHGLYVISQVYKNSADEFAIGITSRERQNPWYLRIYKKVEFEEVYVPPSLVGNKDIRQTTTWLQKGCLFFALIHLTAIIEIFALFFGLPGLAICTDLMRISTYHMIHYFAIKIVN